MYTKKGYKREDEELFAANLIRRLINILLCKEKAAFADFVNSSSITSKCEGDAERESSL